MLPPRKPRFDFVYASLYHDRIQPVIDGTRDIFNRRGVEMSNLVLRNMIVRALWDQESPEVIEKVEIEVENRFAATKKVYEQFLSEEPSDAQRTE